MKVKLIMLENAYEEQTDIPLQKQMTFESDPLALIQINHALRTALARSCDEMRRIRNVGDLFWEPVDTEALEISDYATAIKHPMDLLTLKEKLELGIYQTFGEFIFESALIWQNCRDYNKNAPTAFYSSAADEGERNFVETVTKQAGAMLEGFSWKAYLRILQGVQDGTFKVKEFVKLYHDNLNIVLDTKEEFQVLLTQFSQRLNMLDEQSLGELVDFYLRRRNQLIEIGDHEVELKFEPQDEILLKYMNVLAGCKISDHIKRGRGKRYM